MKNNLQKAINLKKEILEKSSTTISFSIHNQEIKLNEKRALFALEASEVGLWDYDILNNMVFYSDICKEMLGYEEVDIGTNIEEFISRIHPEDLVQALKTNNKHMRGELPFSELEYRLRCKDDSYKWILSRGKIIEFDKKGKPTRMLGTHIDISQKKFLEESFVKQLDFFQNLLDNLPAPVFYKDTNHCYIGCNQAFEDFIGLSKDEVMGKTIFDIAPLEFAKEHHQTDLHLFENPGTRTYGGQLLWRKISPRDLAFIKATFKNKDNEIAGIIGIMHDITKEKEAEKNKLLAIEKFHKVFKYSPIGMELISLKNKIFIDINENFLNFFSCSKKKYQKEDLINNDAMEFFYNFHKEEELVNYILNKIKNRDKIYDYEVEYVLSDGQKKAALISIEYITIDGEECMLGVFKDISERKNFEKEMARMDQLNLIGQMASGIAHEIRNPMTTIRGFLQMLKLNDNFKNEHSTLSIMIEEIDRANNIISEYLSLSKEKSNKVQALDINSIILNLEPLISSDAALLDMNLNLDLQYIPLIQIDKEEIKQLLLNLCRNGFEAMQAGGSLKISTCFTQNKVRLIVQDEGSGIDENTMEKIGTPFFTTKENGNGLGTAIIYNIAKRHNATLEYESSSKGTSVYVDFPLIM